MTIEEQATGMIDRYLDLLRIKKAEDRDKEIDNQLRATKIKLETLGVVTDQLTID